MTTPSEPSTEELIADWSRAARSPHTWQRSYLLSIGSALSDRLALLTRQNKELWELLGECAERLGAYIDAKYPVAVLEHPRERINYERDLLDVVDRIRAALDKRTGEIV